MKNYTRVEKNKNLSCKFISRNILWYEGEQEMNEIIAI